MTLYTDSMVIQGFHRLAVSSWGSIRIIARDFCRISRCTLVMSVAIFFNLKVVWNLKLIDEEVLRFWTSVEELSRDVEFR